MHKYLGIITARKNSKRIKDKNLQLIEGKSLISFTFDAALNSKKIDYLILSTDSKEIIDNARKNKINVPFVRPKSLTGDKITSEAVITHAVKWYKKKNGNYPENIILLQPTSPFRNTKDIDSAIAKFEKSKKDSLISVCRVYQNPLECFVVRNNKLDFFKKGKKIKTEEIYFVDGSIYISKTKSFLKKSILFDEDSEIYVLPKSHGIDINDYFDLSIARGLYILSKKDQSIF